MNSYTVEDLKVLVSMSPPTGPIAFTLKNKNFDPDFFHNMLWAFSKKEWAFVFEVPFEDLGLYVNKFGDNYSPSIEGYLNWRLKISK